MIPKIIHYCWFGKGPLPPMALDCIESWHKYMPDWEYKLWNEGNFDIENSIQYVKEAYEKGKYAFVSDYVRLCALKNYGGLYLDTDVKVFKSFDPLMHLQGFIGYEGTKSKSVGTGVIAAEPGHIWVDEQLSLYENIHFVCDDGSLDMTPNTARISANMCLDGFVQDGTYQEYHGMSVFPTDYFCPRQTTREYLSTNNTFCDHMFCGSWKDGKKNEPFLFRFCGPRLSVNLIKFKRWLIG